MRTSLGSSGPALIDAREPGREERNVAPGSPYVYTAEGGTGRDTGRPLSPEVDRWLRRWTSWRKGFELGISTKVRYYWRLWRNFDDYLPTGPNGSWRDRTMVPEPFKIIEARLPRLVLSQFGGREWMVVEGRERSDEAYEELVKSLIEEALDEIGKGTTEGGFMQRIIEGFRYAQIMGHVWWKLNWRTDKRWIRTRLPMPGEDGKIDWQLVESLLTTYDGLDLQWLPLDSLAVNLKGPRRWAIERVQTSLQALRDENDAFKESTGKYLYAPANLDSLERSFLVVDKQGFSEPRNTERWPLGEDAETSGISPDEHPVELWLCYDNYNRTLTKIANRAVVLDGPGWSPTPDGLDPYWDLKAIPVPNRVYGDSILNWVGDLCTYQTRVKRARADEVLLGMWQQFIYRSGTLKSPQNFLRPGGAMAIDPLDPQKPIQDSFQLVQRHPVLPQAYQEEEVTQKQAEITAAADVVMQGGEGTSKSRDVSATEIQQRTTQGNARYQLENLYYEIAFKQPLLQKAFDWLRMNLTSSRIVRVLGEPQTVDLTALDQPVDFKIGGGTFEYSHQERLQDIEVMVKLGQTPTYAPYIKPQETLEELLRNRGFKDVKRFLRTEEEVEQLKQQAMQQKAMAEGGMPPPSSPMAGPPGVTEGGPQEKFSDILAEATASPSTISDMPGVSAAQALAGVSGSPPPKPPSAGGDLVASF